MLLISKTTLKVHIRHDLHPSLVCSADPSRKIIMLSLPGWDSKWRGQVTFACGWRWETPSMSPFLLRGLHSPRGWPGWAVSPTVSLLLRPLSHKNGEILGDGDSKFLPQEVSGFVFFFFFKEKDINKTRTILLYNGRRKPSRSKKSKLHI